MTSPNSRLIEITEALERDTGIVVVRRAYSSLPIREPHVSLSLRVRRRVGVLPVIAGQVTVSGTEEAVVALLEGLMRTVTA